MSKKLAIALGVALLSVGTQVHAQKNEYFFGAGRAVVNHDEIEDTTSTDIGKTTGGYTLFDLGVSVNREDVIKASAILRVRNEFGGFFGDGVTFQFRQLRLEGVIGDIVKYEIGDLDVALTPYTVNNSDVGFNAYESDLFGIKRNVINYENFFTDDETWRMQGVNTYTTLEFDKGIKTLGIRAFGNRLIGSDNVAIPDRLMYGAKLDFGISDALRVGVNLANVEDIALTIPDTNVIYDNKVMTLDFEGEYGISDDLSVVYIGEAGMSNFGMYKASDDTTVENSDAFVDINAGVKSKIGSAELTAMVGYRQVGQYFNSPTAQTRRIADYASGSNLSVFPTYNDGATSRTQTIFDRYSQESGVYNRAINTTLMAFNPIYNNVTPYGTATPNRSGLTVGIEVADTNDLYQLTIKDQILSEVVAENIDSKRSFNTLLIGGRLNINQLIQWERLVSVFGSYSAESTTRDEVSGFGGVDLKSSMINIGLDVEVMGKLHLLGGAKLHNAEGSEFILSRNEYNVVSETALPSSAEYEISQRAVALGFKYDFSENAVFSASYHMTHFEDAAALEEAFDLNQVYFIYNLIF